MAGAGRYVSLMVRSLLEGLYLSDPEAAFCQVDADCLCSEHCWWSRERNSVEERACRETCVAQQRACLNVFQQKCLVWDKGTSLITTPYKIGLVVFCRHFHLVDSFFSSLLWLEHLSLGDSCKNVFVLFLVHKEKLRRVTDGGVHLGSGPWKGSENTEQPNCSFPGQGSSTSKP